MLEVKNLTKFYKLGKILIPAVKNVSFRLERGEILGLVGESGSGKSTLGRMLLGLIPPTSGEIFFEGKQMQMIFQDPSSSLNPRMTIKEILQEPFKIHRKEGSVDELLEQVGLPTSAKERYPHEFSGGQKQRIGIARALALKPDFILCDEPVSSLDVSLQSQILQLLIHLRETFKLTYLFISHDLSVIQKIATRVAVMYQGEFVEVAPKDTLYTKPVHPYTQLLLASIPRLDLRFGIRGV